MTLRDDDPERAAIAAELADLQRAMLRQERVHAEDIAAVHASHRTDAVNLIHYLALRQTDVRSLQRKLGARGSLPWAVASRTCWLRSKASAPLSDSPQRGVPEALSFDEGRRALDCNTDTLLAHAQWGGCRGSW